MALHEAMDKDDFYAGRIAPYLRADTNPIRRIRPDLAELRRSRRRGPPKSALRVGGASPRMSVATSASVDSPGWN